MFLKNLFQDLNIEIIMKFFFGGIYYCNMEVDLIFPLPSQAFKLSFYGKCSLNYFSPVNFNDFRSI